MAEKSVFISYQRKSEAGSGLARSLELALTQRGYDVFLDVDSIAAGRWSPQIEKELPRRRHFLFILTPGVLELCASPTNWMRREYDLAVESKRNIVPVRSAGFDDALERSRCPPAMLGVFEWQMARVGFETFEKDFPEFVVRFLERHTEKNRPKSVQLVAGGEAEEQAGAGPRRSWSWVAKARLALLVGGLLLGGWLVLREAPPQLELGPAPPANEERPSTDDAKASPPPPQRPVVGDEWSSPSGIRFRFVPAGTYWIGSAEGGSTRFEWEPRHQVELSRGFWLAETELTKGQWRQLVPGIPLRSKACGDDCPVERVSWYTAVSLANELSKREGVQECYQLACSGQLGTSGFSCGRVRFVGLQCAGYRLPTESEWEVALRAGEETAPALAWVARHSGSGEDQDHGVRGKAPNAWGLYDMENVWEWMWDWYGAYPSGLVLDPSGPAGGSGRVIRGGAWVSDGLRVRVADRQWVGPGTWASYLGFRLARGQGRGAPSAGPQE